MLSLNANNHKEYNAEYSSTCAQGKTIHFFFTDSFLKHDTSVINGRVLIKRLERDRTNILRDNTGVKGTKHTRMHVCELLSLPV